MSTRIVCPNCHTAYNATDDQCGRRVRCKQCQAIFYAAGPEEGVHVAAADGAEEGQKTTAANPAVTGNAGQGDRAARAESPSRKKKAPRKIPPFALFLIIGGVGGSLVIVAASIVICIWLWINPPEFTKHPEGLARIPGGHNFPLQPPPRVEDAADANGKDVDPQGADVPQPLPPPPRELEFASPLPTVPVPPAPQGPMNPQLPPELVLKVKRATIYLRVLLADGAISQGSGFFGVEPNVVLTNAHVIGMLRPGSRRPQKIEVVLNSGAADERKLPANVLGVDRHSDLAVLRVDAADLPPPLPVRSARNLQLTQQVYVFGFPFGADLGKEITVSHSSVSSLRWEHGMLAKVQVNGGMHPGNSGGPVVDAYGNVVGVAVSILRATQINFAVPGDQVYAVLRGRIADVSLGQPYRRDGQIRVLVTVRMIDPLASIRAPTVEIWTGEATPPTRPPQAQQPPVEAGDSPHQAYALAYQQQVAQAEIALPPLPPGKAYWVQPKWTNAAGETAWATANAYPLPPPVDQKPVPLVLRHQVGSRPVLLNSWLEFKVTGPDGAEHTATASAQTSLTETTEAVDAQELASVHLQYRAYDVKLRRDNQEMPNLPDIGQARQNIRSLAANLRVDRQGNFVGNEIDLSRVPTAVRRILASFHDEFQRELESLTVPVPNKQVVPGDSWNADKTVLIPTLDRSVPAHLGMTYTYTGTRERAGREEAVLQIKGDFEGMGEQHRHVSGRADGTAGVDLASGQITEAEMVFLFDVEMNSLSRSPSSSGKLTLRLQRELPAADAAN